MSPHGVMRDGEDLYIAMFDYEKDAAVVRLDLESGSLEQVLWEGNGESFGGVPTLEDSRFTHNAWWDGERLLVSDTGNHRVLAMDAAWKFQWAISQESSDDITNMRLFSHPNHVMRFDLNGEPRLMVSARGNAFNHVMLYEPIETLRPNDPPWKMVWRFPEIDDPSVLHQNHNPRPFEDGSGFMVADSGNNRIRAFSWEREELWTFPEVGCQISDADYRFDWPRDAVLTPDGTLMVADSDRDRIVEVAVSGCPRPSSWLWELEAPGIYGLLIIETEP